LILILVGFLHKLYTDVDSLARERDQSSYNIM
jgi:hypothetical protein